MLLPGYVLTLDMIFTPHFTAGAASTGYYNFFPVALLLQALQLVVPVWIIQKIILFLLFFFLGTLSFFFLPVPSHNQTVRLFCALLYTVNPFVYARFLAGHWTHLFAYAFLPLFVHLLFEFTKAPSFKRTFFLFACLTAINIFSLHFFVMAVLLMGTWWIFDLVHAVGMTHDFVKVRVLLKHIFLGMLTFGVLSSYWLVPLIQRGQFFEQRFTRAHFEAFAPTGHGAIPLWLNILSLNGFWGEASGWGAQFLWPQNYALFWIAMGALWFLCFLGIWKGLSNPKYRTTTIFWCVIGFFAFVFATGAGNSLFKSFNLFLFEHIPFWRGFRDSQKFVGIEALAMCVLSGYGAITLFERVKHQKEWMSDVVRSLLFGLVLAVGMFVWKGFVGQVRPVWYPPEWFEVKKIVDALPQDSKVLFLPWHGHLSFGFNNNILLASPLKSFFGSKAVVSRSIELGQLYDQELDPHYRAIDALVTGNTNLSVDDTLNALKAERIDTIVFFQDLVGSDSLSYLFVQSSRLGLTFDTSLVKIFRIDAP